MKINKLFSLGLMVAMCSACTTNKTTDTPKQEADINQQGYKIFSLDNGGTNIEIAENKKALSIGLNTKLSDSFFNMRDRTVNDKYEQICLGRQFRGSEDLKLVTCLNEKNAENVVVNPEDKVFNKDDVSKGIEKISIPKGLKLEKFSFNLDGNQRTEYTTRKMDAYDQPESYTVIRLLTNKNVWSGKRMLLIQEH